MALAPVELRHVSFGRGLLGYRRGSVDDWLVQARESFEEVWRERADLAEKVDRLESDLVRYRELETLLRTTLVSAERAAQDLKDHARREADLLLQEARVEARSITRGAAAERERLLAETHRVRALLSSALKTLEEEHSPAARAEAA